MGFLKAISKRVIRQVAAPILERCLRFLDSRRWMPVFYFSIIRDNTNAVFTLHALNNIQVKTGRRVFVITPWPFWPWESGKDPFFTSLIKGLNPRIHLVFVSVRVDRLIFRLIAGFSRLLQLYSVLNRAQGLNATIRLGRVTTVEQNDLVGCSVIADIFGRGSRVVFHIPKSHEHTLERKLKSIGVSPDDWFICAHAREHGYYKELKPRQGRPYRPEHSDNRNVDIQDYFPAFEFITSKGGKVVRVGDPTMTRVDGIDGVIDYPFTDEWNMFMDIYLASRCRFILGCASGFAHNFGQSFGTPSIETNSAVEPATSIRLPYDNNLILPKRMEEIQSGDVLPLREMFHPRFRFNESSNAIRSLGYRWLSNTPEDILEVTKEVLDLIETDSFGGPMTEEQELFHRYRLKALEAEWSLPTARRDINFADLHQAQSRISATYAARYFSHEPVEKIVVGLTNDY